MAQKVQTLYVDDLDGSEADGTIRFGLDGAEYEIDLNTEHTRQLRDALARYISAARRAGIIKRIGPHTLRHAFITAALDAGVPLRDVQEAASHADPRTTMRNDRARVSLDRHATYIVAAFLACAAC